MSRLMDRLDHTYSVSAPTVSSLDSSARRPFSLTTVGRNHGTGYAVTTVNGVSTPSATAYSKETFTPATGRVTAILRQLAKF
jgi:hypothetical protein